MREPDEYGFYDGLDPDKRPTWYLFGMPFHTVEEAKRSGSKNTYGSTVIVRRRAGQIEWEHLDDGV